MRHTPPNVHLVRLTKREFFQRLAHLDANYSSTAQGRATLESYFQYVIDMHPYILVELKPSLGFLFSDFVRGYSHWAYADLDLLVGRLSLQITAQELQHDIVTLTFGDNYRLYLRGQMTIHANKPHLNSLWQGCAHLATIGQRMETFFAPNGRWAFQSAEGCYSKVAADMPGLSILYLPVQLSDAFKGTVDQKETIVVGAALLRCFEQPITPQQLLSLDPHQRTRGTEHKQMWMPLGRVEPPDCEYWVAQRHQVC
ncbi:hypothetical protein B484DRAFT_326088, partial [Ochromonadaceae sp. CCMP2298]